MSGTARTVAGWLGLLIVVAIGGLLLRASLVPDDHTAQLAAAHAATLQAIAERDSAAARLRVALLATRPLDSARAVRGAELATVRAARLPAPPPVTVVATGPDSATLTVGDSAWRVPAALAAVVVQLQRHDAQQGRELKAAYALLKADTAAIEAKDVALDASADALATANLATARAIDELDRVKATTRCTIAFGIRCPTRTQAALLGSGTTLLLFLLVPRH